ncbi:adhesion G-protein coupled receptor G4-like isoform X1 [Rhopilema esculentum]|uniref:adhesion G-protein coupled receptor G4-like isoform X1 n=1 Tax=Rhopilema esculentum TaxID=499914 RepID=UPI0031E021F7
MRLGNSCNHFLRGQTAAMVLKTRNSALLYFAKVTILLWTTITSSTSTTIRICEHAGKRTVGCPAGVGHFMNITHAMYGRTTQNACSAVSSQTNCRSPLAMSKVSRECHGVHSCVVEAANSIFGDPCTGVLKYLDIFYSCLYGDDFNSIANQPDGYVYSNQLPSEAVLELTPNTTDFVTPPLIYTIYKIIESNYEPLIDESRYQKAVDFLSKQLKVPQSRVQPYTCMPSVNDFGSQFCIYKQFGYIFTSATFIPAMYVGRSYELGMVVRDYSAMPVVRKTTIRINVVPKCFPFPNLYSDMQARCPSSASKFTFPSGLAWSISLFGDRFPIDVTSSSALVISRISIDTSLLVGFQNSQSYWKYEIKFHLPGTSHVREFMYVPSVLDYTNESIVQVRGTKLNITISPPIYINPNTKFVNVSMKLTSGNVKITFNSENTFSLFGSPKMTICPDSFCMNSYRKWLAAVNKVRYTINRDCIQDEGLQEAYLKQCNSDPCYRSFDVPLSTSAGEIIYHFRNQGLFTRFVPSLYRVILYEYANMSFSGYSSKYFCSPKPFQDSRRFICLNRYAGRLRVRIQSPFDFPLLRAGTVFTIEVQAEGTVNASSVFDRCTFDIRLTAVTPPIRTTTVTTNPSSIIASTNALSKVTVLTWKPTITSSIHVAPATSSSIATTTTITHRPPLLNDSLEVTIPKNIRTGQPFVLTCKRSLQIAAEIKWYKDGVLLPQTGSTLMIAAATTPDQGYYQCSSRYSGIVSFSPKELFVLQDVFTSSVYLEIVNRVFTADLTDTSSAGYGSLSKEITEIVKRIIVDVPSSSGHNINVEAFRKGSIVAQVSVASAVASGTTMTSYYNEMTSKLLAAATSNGFGDFQVPAAGILIANKVYCFAETTSAGSKGPYQWPETAFGLNATISCPHGPAAATATRRCAGDYNSGASWDDLEDTACNFNNKRTSELNMLSEVTINSTNAETIASNLNDLTKNSTMLTTDDTLLASETFENLAASNATSEKIVDDMLKIASNILETNESTLASSQTQGKALTKIVNGIVALADKIPLPNKTGVPVVRVSSGVAIQAMRIDSKSKASLSFALQSTSFSNGSVVSNQNYDRNEVAVGLTLPETLMSDVKNKGENRVSFVAYRGNQFFQSTKKNALGRRVIDYSSKSNSLVISAHVKGAGRVNLSQPLTGTFQQTKQSKADKCVFWDFKANNGYGGWSSEGCRKASAADGRVECKCDHMTNFAIIFDVYAGAATSHDPTHETVLGIISFIGIGLSLGGLIITLVTLLLFRRLRRTLPSRILIHLSLSLILTLLSFVIGADRTESLYVCRGFAIVIQYFLLACFLWMSVEAINLYLSFVVVMGSYVTRFILKAAIYAWGLPLVIVAITASLRISDYGNKKNCIVSGYSAYGTLFGPICLIILLNILVFARVYYALQSSDKKRKVSKDQQRSGISQLRIAASFSAILGLTWVFGIFAIGDGRLFFQYLFCIFNSLQGFVIFYLHVARHEDARNHWIHLITGKGLNYHRATISSSSGKTLRHGQSEDKYRLRLSSGDKSNTLTSTLEKQTKNLAKESSVSEA